MCLCQQEVLHHDGGIAVCDSREIDMSFSLTEFVRYARSAAADTRPVAAVKTLMSQTFADPQVIAKAVGSFISADECLYEDDEVSVYWVRFAPHELVPPHNHRMHAFLGVYEGIEVNLLYRQAESGQLELVKRRVLNPGDTMVLGGDGIHAVHTEGAMPSLGLHIYLGRLSTVSRELFDTETGRSMPFTDENYQMLLRPLGVTAAGSGSADTMLGKPEEYRGT